MKKLLLLLVFPALLFGGKSNVQYDSATHAVTKPPTVTGKPDYDYTGLNVVGLSAGGGGTGTPGGTNTQFQFNNAFTFGGIPYATYDGTAMTFRTGSRFMLADPTDILKKTRLDLSAIASGTTRQVKIAPSADSVTVIAGTAAANNFVTGIDANGVILTAQPSFSNLSGLLSLSQTTMSTNKLLGRGTAGTGAIEEITLGTNLSLSGTTLNASGGGGGGTPGGADTQFQYNNASAFGGTSNIVLSGGQVKAIDSNFVLRNIIDNTKQVTFSLANVPTATTESIIVANAANPVIPKPDVGAANNFLTGISAAGIITKAQPAFTDISGVIALGQQNIPMNLQRFVDPVNGSDITGAANLAKPFLTIAGAASGAPAGTVIYPQPNLTGYDQGTTPFVIPAGVTIAGAGADSTLIKGAVTGVTRAVVEPSTSSAIYNVTIQNTSSTGVAFGVGSASTAFTSAYIGGSKIISNAQGIYINKAGTTGLVIENTTISTQNDCIFQNISTAVTETRNCDLLADGSVTLTESKGLNIMNGTIRFNYGSITVGGATGTNVGAFGSGASSRIELHGVRMANSLGGATNYDLQAQSSAFVGKDMVYRSDAAALATNGTITELSRYAVIDNNLTDFPAIGSGTRGDIIFRGATGWTKLAAGIDGTALITHGNTADPTWTAVSGSGGLVDDTAFGVIWNGSTTSAPSQNAMYDYLHLMSATDNGKVGLLNQTAGITNTDAGGVVQTALAAPSGVIVGNTDVQTLTNKRITKRQLSTAVPGPTPSINTDDYDVVHYTGMNADAVITVTGTPQPPDSLRFDFTDDGSARALTWDVTKFYPSPGQALPTTTVGGSRLDVLFLRDSVAGKWRCVASSQAQAVSGAGTVTSVGLTGANGITVTGASPITSSGSFALTLPITLAGTTGKTLTVSNSLTLSGTDGSTLNVGAGGTLGSAAYTASTAYLASTALSDSVWAAGWNGDTTTAPSRNAIYDWGHTFDTDDNGKVNVLDLTTAELVKTNTSGVVSSAVGGTDYANLAWKTVSVSGQSDVVADSAADTLTLAAGSNVTITTTPGTDTVTIAATGGGGGGASATKQDVGDADATITGGVTVINLTTALTAPRVITLPAANTYNPLSPLVIVDPVAVENSTNTISLARAGSDTINGGTSNVTVLAAPEAGGSVSLISDGTSKWTTISKGGGSRFAKGDGNAAHYLDGTGGYTTPAGGGTGTVTNFSAGDLSPLFTTTEATTTTTPALSFALTNAAATTVFGRAAGTSGAPTYSSAPQFLKIGNLTSNGFVKTGSGDGTLSVDTATYLTSVTPGGSDTQVQFNDGGALGGNAGLTFTKASGNTKIGSSTEGFDVYPAYAGNGDIPASVLVGSRNTHFSFFPSTTAVSSTIKLVLGYWNGGGRSAVEIANVASGDGSLLLMKGGGVIQINSTDTAIGRNAAGVMEINNGTMSTYRDLICRNITISGGNFSGRINPRASGGCDETSSATSTPTSDSCDQWDITALAAADVFVAPSGTPVNGQKLVIRIKDNGTARALTFPTASSGQYRFSSDMPAPTTTVISKTMYLGFKWNAADSRWDNVAQLNNF